MFDVRLDLVKILFREFNRALMGIIPVCEEFDALEFTFNLNLILYLGFAIVYTSPLLTFLNIGKGVAEVRPNLLLVILVVSHAEPTELIFARAASHVHAALVLLDGTLAFGAFLCV